jgi:hypothetical protein
VTTINNGASPAECKNSTTGYQANLETTNLSASIISDNFTFPSPFPALAWAVKKASTPREQYDVDFLGANPFCDPKVLCYGDCDATVLGEYQILLNELNNTGSLVRTVFRFEGDATTSWNVIQVDLDESDINTSAPHQIIIATDVDDVSSPLPRRMWFDEFRIQSLSQPLIANCTDYCDGNDLIDATEQDGACFLTRIVNESSCVAEQEAIAEAEALAQQLENLAVIPIVGDLLADSGLNETVIEESGLSFAVSFFSPFFLSIIIIIVLGGFLEFKVAQASKGGGGHGTIFGIVMLIGTIFLTMLGVFPIGFAIVFTIISGFIVVWTVLKTIKG